MYLGLAYLWLVLLALNVNSAFACAAEHRPTVASFCIASAAWCFARLARALRMYDAEGA